MTQAPLPGTPFDEAGDPCVVVRLLVAYGATWVRYRREGVRCELGMTLEAWACYEAARRAR